MAGEINSSTLYVVATPIGNLGDITFRAIEVLREVNIIACEDTRNTSRLCERYDIKTRLISYHKFSEAERSELFLEYLKEGKSIALVSDAGTPLISDPGEILVQKVREAGFAVVPIVGASALLALLAAIPRNTEDFKFIGFLPRVKGQIQKIFCANAKENLVFYESPNRIEATIEALVEVRPEANLAIGRELTKKFEQIKSAPAKEILHDVPLKGEFACMVYADEKSEEEIFLVNKIAQLKNLNYTNKDIISIINTLFDINKNLIKKNCLK